MRSHSRLMRTIKANSHTPYRAPAVSCRANLDMACCAPAVIRKCRVIRESPRVAGKIPTVDRETPHGSRKKPNLGRSPTRRREKTDVNSHIPCRAPAMLCRVLEKSLAKRHGRSTACYVSLKHGRTVLFKWGRHNLNF